MKIRFALYLLLDALLATTVHAAGPPLRSADAKLPRLVDAVLGPRNRDVDAPELIWQFFARVAPP